MTSVCIQAEECKAFLSTVDEDVQDYRHHVNDATVALAFEEIVRQGSPWPSNVCSADEHIHLGYHPSSVSSVLPLVPIVMKCDICCCFRRRCCCNLALIGPALRVIIRSGDLSIYMRL